MMIGTALPYIMLGLLAVMTNTAPPPPESETVKVGLSRSLVAMVIVDERGPFPWGVNVTVSKQFELAATAPAHESDSAKSPGFSPEKEAAVMGVNDNATGPVLESVRVSEAVAGVVTLPKDRAAGAIAAKGAPAPPMVATSDQEEERGKALQGAGYGEDGL